MKQDQAAAFDTLSCESCGEPNIQAPAYGMTDDRCCADCLARPKKKKAALHRAKDEYESAGYVIWQVERA